MAAKIFYSTIGFFAFGVGLASLFKTNPIYAVLFLLLAIFVFIWGRYLASQKTGDKKLFLFLIVAFGSIAFGILRFEIADRAILDQDLDAVLGRRVLLTGLVATEPDVRENQTRLIVDIEKLGSFSEGQAVSGKVIVSTGRFPIFSYGDRVTIQGILAHPQAFETDTGAVFDYPSYLAKDGIGYEISFANVGLLESGQGNFLLSKLLIIKHSLQNGISLILPEPQASLLGGLLLGAKQSLGADLLEAFRSVGLIHIIVLSGYNLTIVGEFIRWLFARLPRGLGLWMAVLSIIGFALMTGASATTVRATVMALLALLARATGRTYEMTRALFLAGALMIIHNPKLLVFDPSFQLSFLATMGLIFLSPIIFEKLKFLPKKFGFREIASATISTQIFVMPLLLYTTGQLSLISIIANLLVLIFVPMTMLCGFIAAILALIKPAIALPAAFSAYALLSYILFLTEGFAKLPFASIRIPLFPWWAALVLYLFLGLWLISLYRNRRMKPLRISG